MTKADRLRRLAKARRRDEGVVMGVASALRARDDADALTAGAKALDVLALAEGVASFAVRTRDWTGLSVPEFGAFVEGHGLGATKRDARRDLGRQMLATALRLLADAKEDV